MVDNPLSDVEFAKEFHRFQTKEKARAFSLMQELEKSEKVVYSGVVEKDGKKYMRFTKTSWRTSMNFSRRISFDIDSHDMKNLAVVVGQYSNLFGIEFNIIKSKHGYHLISEKPYTSKEKWLYDVCRVLYPLLEQDDVVHYIELIKQFYKDRKAERDTKERSRKELQELTKDFEEKFKKSGLYCGYGNFEILYAVNVIMRGFYSLRISKKDKQDCPEMIKL